MNNKKCVFCASLNIIKKGKQNNNQRYYCKDCKKKFQANRKPPLEREEVFYFFTFHKQTFKEMSRIYHIRRSEVQKIIDEFKIPSIIHKAREVYLQIDATYFGTKENKFCLILFRDHINKQNLWWKFVDVEKDIYYIEGRSILEGMGYVIKGVTTDGLPLFRRVFRDIPHQMCLVHMERIIIIGTTRKPKLEAGKILLALAKSIHTINEKRFNYFMSKFTLKYFLFLNEKTTSEETGESWYTHQNLRDAFISLQNLQDYLFTYTRDHNISKNTNSIESVFGNIKNKLKVHNGLSVERKKKLIEILLLDGSGVFDYEKRESRS